MNDQAFRDHLKHGLNKVGFDYWLPRMPMCVVGHAVVINPHINRVVTVDIDSGFEGVTDHDDNDVEWDPETRQVAELLNLLGRPETWQSALISEAGIFPNETDILSWFEFNDVQITEKLTEGGCHVTSSLGYTDIHRVAGPSATDPDRLRALALVLLACNDRRP